MKSGAPEGEVIMKSGIPEWEVVMKSDAPEEESVTSPLVITIVLLLSLEKS